MFGRVRFLGDSDDRIRSFPKQARKDVGYELWRVELGRDPKDWKPMPTIGAGVKEIRVKDISGAFRVIYVTNIGAHIFVVHAFQKKTQATAKKDIDLAKARYKELRRWAKT